MKDVGYDSRTLHLLAASLMPMFDHFLIMFDHYIPSFNHQVLSWFVEGWG